MEYTGDRQKILVADDRAENRLVLLNMLEPLGFDVTLAEDGQDCLTKAREIQPDFILMDLVMPVMTGFEAVEEIRQIPELHDVPIVAISASVFDMDQEKSRIAGCDGFLPKPIETPRLFALMEHYLPIEWVEDIPVEHEAVPSSQAAAELIPPPQEELEAVYELAVLGKMKRIREYADHLEELDERYLSFANTLRNLAREFDNTQIEALVKHYLEENS